MTKTHFCVYYSADHLQQYNGAPFDPSDNTFVLTQDTTLFEDNIFTKQLPSTLFYDIIVSKLVNGSYNDIERASLYIKSQEREGFIDFKLALQVPNAEALLEPGIYICPITGGSKDFIDATGRVRIRVSKSGVRKCVINVHTRT